MTTNSNTDRRATATPMAAAGRKSATYPCAVVGAVVWPSESGLNFGGHRINGQALRPEGLARKDRRQLQH
ncbi:MAG: hypothetical protein JOZ96_07440 [Acidobacteria bacterium]|nr:hypothetical protein [Acidobacteriota bacterium]